MNQLQETYEKLVACVVQYDHAYWVMDQPAVSDLIYDQTVKQIKELEDRGVVTSAQSPTKRIGSVLTVGFKKANHIVPMLSLDNIFDIKSLEKTMTTMQSKVTGGLNWMVEPKVDGLSVDLCYKMGRLTQALTRGNGEEGDDVTANVMTIRTVPMFIPVLAGEDLLHIRGEVFMSYTVLDELNKQRKEAGEEKLANPRNAAAGALKLLDPKEVAKRKLSFVPYHVIMPSSTLGINCQAHLLDFFKKAGFTPLGPATYCCTIEAAVEAISKFEAIKKHLDYATDGAVIKVNSFEDRNEFPNGTRALRWAYAFKYAPSQVETKLKGVTFQVGRQGAITPVAELEPVELDGSVICRSTLHNEQRLIDLDLKLGDVVVIAKAGSVIPEVVSVVKTERTGSELAIKFPTKCPICSSYLIRAKTEDGEGSAWVCANTQDCPAQVMGRIEKWCSKEALDFQDVGPDLLSKLVPKFVTTVAGLYVLCEQDFEGMKGVGARTVDNFSKQVEKSKSMGLERVLIGLGIPRLGEGSAKRLAKHFPDLKSLLAASEEELAKVKDFGPVNIREFVDWRRSEGNQKLCENLEEYLIMKSKSYNPTAEAGGLAGKIFVITGTLTMPRDQAEKMVEDRGGKVTGSVSKKTTYVVVGEDPGKNKTEGAAKHSVPILNEDQFLKMMEESE